MIHVDVWQKPTQYCKAIIFQLKRKKNWSRLPFPPPGNFPDSGVEPASPLAGGFGKPSRKG